LLSASRQTLLRPIASDEPTAPRELNPSVAAELETILLKAAAKDQAALHRSFARLLPARQFFSQSAKNQTLLRRIIKAEARGCL
jgi:hypothetical protein